jgi:hypothetical protein
MAVPVRVAVVVVAMVVRVPVGVLSDAEQDQHPAGDVVEPSQIGQAEIRLRPEEGEHDRDGAYQVTDPENTPR